jgi:arabinose-5-phosphate isomerase
MTPLLAAFSPATDARLVALARNIVRAEAVALDQMAEQLGNDFAACARLFAGSPGMVVVTGLGKAGLVGQKISATFASTGVRSLFLHPTEALHGDLGRLAEGDCVLALSASGETEELLELVEAFNQQGRPVVALTRSRQSPLGRAANLVLELGDSPEACPLGLAPSVSTTCMLALGDALAFAASQLRGFRRGDFARLHPGGQLGRKLAPVDAWMRPLAQCRLAAEESSVRSVIVATAGPARRSGAIMLTDASGRLSGVFTDSDLARLFETHREHNLDRPIAEVMTRQPTTVSSGTLLSTAVSLLGERKLSELPVVDAERRPVGLLDITDVVGHERHGVAPRVGSNSRVQPQRRAG